MKINFDSDKFVENIRIGLENLQNNLLDAVQNFQINLRESLQNLQSNIEKGLAKNYQEIHIKLNRRSWYIISELRFSELNELMECNDDEKLDSIMVAYSKRIIDDTETRLITQFPKREQIVKQAFFAHRQGCFSLSVPTMLIQADGIGNELFQVSIFSKKNGEPKTKEVIQKFDTDNLTRSMHLLPLEVLTSIMLNTDHLDEIQKTDEKFGPLNRHGIIHGLTTDFGTEINSLRCIVLLSFLLDIKEEFIDSDPDKI